MYCGKCGAQIADDAVFCGNCGAAVGGQGAPQTEKKQSVNSQQARKVGLIAIAAVAVVVVILLISAIAGGGGYEKSVENLGKGLQNADAKLLLEVLFTGTVEGEEMEELDVDEWEEVLEEFEDTLEDSLEHLEDLYGSNVKIKTSVKNDQKLKGDDLEDAIEMLEMHTNSYEEDTVKEVVKLDIIIEISGKKDDEKLKISNVYAVRTKEGWSLNFDTARGDVSEFFGW